MNVAREPAPRFGPPGLVWAGAAAVFLAALFAAPARAQVVDEKTRRAALDGTHVFRRLLFQLEMTPLTDFEQLGPDTILVMLGKTDRMREVRTDRMGEVREGLAKFVSDGGAVLLATDRPLVGTNRGELLAAAGVGVNRRTLVCQADQFRIGPREVCYNGLDYCPFLVPLGGARPELFRNPHGDTSARLRVATNVPSMLVREPVMPGQVALLATLPPFCFQEEPDGRLQPVDEAQPSFAVGGDHGRGRVLVLADHSVFINQMMQPENTNNFEFAVNCMRWLSDGGRRKKVLFVEDGNVLTKFDVPMQQLRIPPGEALRMLWANRDRVAVAANDALVRLERRHDLNGSVAEWLGDQDVTPPKLARAALLLLSLVGLVWGVFRLGVRHRVGPDRGVPPLGLAVAGSVPPRPLLEQRQQALLRSGNLYEPAHELARRWFADAGGAPGAAPRVHAAGGWWARWRVRRQVRRLWALAFGKRPRRVRAGAFRWLLREMEDLRAARARGELVLEWPGERGQK